MLEAMTSAARFVGEDPDDRARAGQGDDPNEPTWTIADIAGEFGVTHRTLRHYEQIGLISPKRSGTQRVFRRRDRTRLNLILRGKRVGFTLEEARRIVDMYDDLPGEAGQLRYLLEQISDRRADLDRRRRDLDESLTELDDLEQRCIADLDHLNRGHG